MTSENERHTNIFALSVSPPIIQSNRIPKYTITAVGYFHQGFLHKPHLHFYEQIRFKQNRERRTIKREPSVLPMTEVLHECHKKWQHLMLVTEEEASGSEPVWHLCPGNQQGSEVFLVAINLAAWVLGTGSYFLPHSEGGSEKQVMGPHPRGWKMG